jgi:hypothetical protein
VTLPTFFIVFISTIFARLRACAELDSVSRNDAGEAIIYAKWPENMIGRMLIGQDARSTFISVKITSLNMLPFLAKI